MAEGKELKPEPIPDLFIERIRKSYSSEIAENWVCSLNDPPAASIRLNAQKPSIRFLNLESVPWSDNGRYLTERPNFAADPGYHAGSYYPQESSSMCIEWVLQQLPLNTRRIDALDVSAAPGGKTLILSDHLKGRGRVIANEIDPKRCAVLAENVSRWGCDNVIVSQATSSQLKKLAHRFQLILVDAPCSGEGMFRKDHHARKQWNPGLVQACAVIQMQILADVKDLLEPGGYLIYSTCTFSEEENIHQLDRLCRDHEFENVNLKPPSAWNIVEEFGKNASVLKFIPGKVRGEGFTIGVLRKVNGTSPKIVRSLGEYREIDPRDLRNMPDSLSGLVYSDRSEMYNLSRFDAVELNRISQAIHIRKAGIGIGSFVGGALIPHHELAMVPELNSSFPSIPVDVNMARCFLSGETWPMVCDPGWHWVAYETLPLGWIKSLGNRFNNYLPKSLRLRNRELRS
jgi:16S rRNA C967 or C1407 C5-methylase (RsmB/RsmF family)/NOL1/NOP2/fmu family ribosome biogenesis protein